MKRSRIYLVLSLLMLLAVVAGCRRDLWVYQDEFKSVELDIDWRNYFREWGINPYVEPASDPAGMTVWFFPRDGRQSMKYTTTQVRKFEAYLSKGDYDGMVIDYSPEEYGHQEFVGMDFANTAKVQATPHSYQPNDCPELFGEECYAHPLSKKNENGFYTVANEPENIGSDTIQMTINTGKYDKYIPYKERNTYQETLVKQVFNMEPLIIPWDMRIRVYIKGIYYLWKAHASLAGVADGYYLVKCESSDEPCLLNLEDWEIHVTGDNVGYIAKTFKTWGPMNFQNRNWDVHVPQRPLSNREYSTSMALDTYSYEELSSRNPDEMRLNLRLVLRDRSTVMYYHFDVGNLINVFRNEYALRIDLLDGFDGQPDLPYVDGYNGMEFGGVVVPWEDGPNVDVDF
jgi:hypothetical protein